MREIRLPDLDETSAVDSQCERGEVFCSEPECQRPGIAARHTN